MAGTTFAPKTAQAAGCYKCGKTGHWARDCTVPPDQWAPRSAPGAPGAAVASTPEIDPDNANTTPPPAEPKRQRSSKKRKLEVEDLKKPCGFGAVFTTFPQHFRRQFKGKGHEAADLRRLLKLYRDWQWRVFPYAPYHSFVEQLEKLGTKHTLKVELRELRQDVLKVLEEEARQKEQARQAELDAEAAGTAGRDDGEDGTAAEPVAQYDDDDELLDLQNQSWEVAGTTAPRRAPAAAATTDYIDDDELLDLAYADAPPPPQHRAAPAELDDDELLDLAYADAPPPQQAQQPRPSSTAPSPRAGAAGRSYPPTELDDEELLELVFGSNAAPAPAAALLPEAGAASAAAVQAELDDEELLDLALGTETCTESGIEAGLAMAPPPWPQAAVEGEAPAPAELDDEGLLNLALSGSPAGRLQSSSLQHSTEAPMPPKAAGQAVTSTAEPAAAATRTAFVPAANNIDEQRSVKSCAEPTDDELVALALSEGETAGDAAASAQPTERQQAIPPEVAAADAQRRAVLAAQALLDDEELLELAYAEL